MKDKMKNIRNVKPRHKKALENDGEKTPPVKKQKLQRFLLFLLVRMKLPMPDI